MCRPLSMLSIFKVHILQFQFSRLIEIYLPQSVLKQILQELFQKPVRTLLSKQFIAAINKSCYDVCTSVPKAVG